MVSQSGYVPCACRDCFDIAIADNQADGALCHECEEAGCGHNDGECKRSDAYGADEPADAVAFDLPVSGLGW